MVRDGEGLGKTQFWKALVSCNNVDLVLRVAVETVLMASPAECGAPRPGEGCRPAAWGRNGACMSFFRILFHRATINRARRREEYVQKDVLRPPLSTYSAPHRFSSIDNQ